MKNNIRIILLSVTLLLLGSCAGPTHTFEMEPTGTKVLKGYFHRGVMEDDTLFTWYKPNYASYVLDSAAIMELRPMTEDLHFVIVLGTWCGDSKREVPHSMKVLDALKVSDSDVILFGVDRTKKSPDGVTEKLNIQRVPTLIVFKGETELGRIVEHAKESQERDLLNILGK